MPISFNQGARTNCLKVGAFALLIGAITSPVVVSGQVSGAPVSGAGGAQWKLSPEPVLSIGEDGTPQGEFLRISGVTRTATGDIVVANGGSMQLRIFNPSGKFVKSYGRNGSGPGEFQSMQWIGKSSDSLFLYDLQAMRLSTFTVKGGFQSSRAIAPITPDARINPVARFSNGDLLVHPLVITSMRHPDGVYRDSTRLGVLRTTRADSINWIGTFPYSSGLAFNPQNTEKAKSVGTYTFGASSRWVVWSNLLWIGDGDSNEIQLVDKTGKLTSKIRTPWSARPYDRAAFDRMAKKELADMPQAEREKYAGALLSPKYLPRSEPFFKRFHVSPEGYVWFERFNVDAAASTECVVMTRNGTVVARLTIPDGFEPMEIGDDYVLGIKRNRDGLETVAMYRIWK